jgi:hypothetical protein
MEMFRKQM